MSVWSYSHRQILQARQGMILYVSRPNCMETLIYASQTNSQVPADRVDPKVTACTDETRSVTDAARTDGCWCASVVAEE